MKKSNIILILIIILAIFLRFFDLGKIPGGFYSDEAAYGYNAYSILQTGKDEYGIFYPLAFKSFGEYKTPLYIYTIVPFVKLFGLTEFGVRILSVLLGIGVVILTYMIAINFFKNKKISLYSTFFVAISPFALQFNRMAHENNLSLFLIVLSIWFFQKSLKNINYIILSFLLFGLSMYAHNDSRLLAPLMIFCLIINYWKRMFTYKKQLFFSLILFMIISFPLLQLINTSGPLNRPMYVSIFSDKGLELQVIKERNEDKNNQAFLTKINHNRIITTGLLFIENYFKQYSVDFLFMNGDPIKIYSTVNSGLMYIICLPFFFIGIYFLLRDKITGKKILIIWIVLAPVPAALTRFVPSASRMFIIMPVLSILIAYGLYKSFNRVGAQIELMKYLIPVLLFLNVSFYMHNYFVNSPMRYAREWHYGVKQVMNYVKENNNKYDRIWFSRNVWGYIYPLFYLQYPPQIYQQQAKLSNLNEYGFGWVGNFDKYIFDDFPQNFNQMTKVLFIGAPSDYQMHINPIHTVKYPDGSPAFYITDTDSFGI